jgi:hypothetical protein
MNKAIRGDDRLLETAGADTFADYVYETRAP